MSAKIEALILTQDVVEVVRDRIAAILAIECANQAQLALDSLSEAEARDYKISVYVENERPWESGVSGAAMEPAVNVSVSQTAEDASGSVRTGRFIGTYHIDSYGFSAGVDNGLDDRVATMQVWKVARVIRNILAAEEYTYLELRGVVGWRRNRGIKAGKPGNLAESAFAVSMTRMTLDVSFEETAPEISGVELEAIGVRIDDKDGRVLVEI